MDAKSFIKNALKYSIPTVVSAMISIIIIPIITRIYPADDYGKISMFYSVGVMMASIFTFGLASACVRFFYEPVSGTTKEQTFNYTFFVGIITDLIIGVIAVLFFSKNAGRYLFGENNRTALIAFFIYIASTILYRIQSNYSRLSFDSKKYNIQQVSYIIVNKVLFVFAAIWSTKYSYSIYIITALLAVQVLIFGRIGFRIRFDIPPRKARKQLLSFAFPLLPTDIAVMLNNSSAKLLLSYYGDFTSLGIISMATNVANTFNLVSNAFSVYWGPFMYANYKKEQKMIQTIHNVMEYVSILMVGLIFIFQNVIYLILGNEYKESQPYFLLIMLMPIQLLICETTSYGINISKKTYFSFIISSISCLINVGIGYFLYPYFGSIAMAYGIATSAIIQMILKTIIAQKYYVSIKSLWQTMFGILTISIICVLNTLVYSDFRIRLLIGVAVLLISTIVYRKELKGGMVLIKNFIIKKRR